MARRNSAKIRVVIPDVKYGKTDITRFINCLTKRGEKSKAMNIMYGALEIVGEKNNGGAIECFEEAVANVKPEIEVRSRRIGGATYQVPTMVNSKRSLALAIRWLIIAASKRSERTMREKLALELMAAQKKTGAAVKKSEEVRKMADANKAFAHFKV